MKKFAAVLIILQLFFAPFTVSAGSTFDYWIKSISKKLQSFSKADKKEAETSVVGVKGSKDDADELYWKDAEGPSEEELRAFSEVIALIGAGETDKARAALEAFVAQYADSELAEDALEGLKAIKEE